MTAPAQDSVWIFQGDGASFASAAFTTRAAAEIWIRANRLSGTLTIYPLDVSVYDWAIGAGYFTPKRDDQRSPHFIGGFSSANQEHYHYDAGDAS